MSEQSTMPPYTKPLPDMRPEGDHWWEAMRNHTFLLPTDSQGKPFWYPRALVPGTLEPVQWVESPGTGTVYTYSIHYFGPSKAYKGDPPHVVVLVDLDEGVRLMSNIVDAEVERVNIGMPVEVTFEDVTDEFSVFLFRPRSTSE